MISLQNLKDVLQGVADKIMAKVNNKQDEIPTYTLAEYESIKDNIPTGTLFNISDDKTQVTNAGTNKYSTDEIICGEWIDGKPIYRRVYKIHPINMDAGYIIDAPSNIDICINVYGFIKQQGFTIPYGFYNGSNTWMSAFYRNGKIEIRGASEYGNNDTYCIIEYTKTTD